jgi:uncharacterized protein
MPTYPFRTALVTGASAGIGLAILERLVADGVTVVAVARRADRLEELAARYAGVEAFVADLRAPADVARVCDRAAMCDLVVNNAGFGVHGPVATADEDELIAQIGVNVTALVRITRGALGLMIERRRGWVLNISSVAGGLPTKDGAVYSASKAFVTNFSDAVALETADANVVVCASLPGYTRSEFHEVSGTADAIKAVPKFMWQSADDVAKRSLQDVAAGRTRSVPGAHNRVAVQITRHAPRRLIERLIDSRR